METPRHPTDLFHPEHSDGGRRLSFGSIDSASRPPIQLKAQRLLDLEEMMKKADSVLSNTAVRRQVVHRTSMEASMTQQATYFTTAEEEAYSL